MARQGGTVAAVYERDGRQCWICREYVRREDASRDHIKARSVGGYNKSKNYRLAHKVCNEARGDLAPSYIEQLQRDHPHAKQREVVALLQAEGHGA